MTKKHDAKILLRKAECLIKLGRKRGFELLRQDLKEAIDALPESARGNKLKQIKFQ